MLEELQLRIILFGTVDMLQTSEPPDKVVATESLRGQRRFILPKPGIAHNALFN